MPAALKFSPPADFIEFKKEAIHQGIHERIEAQARLHPSRVAIRTADTTYTYREMNGFANPIAVEILSAKGTSLAQAAILQRTTPGMILSMLGCLKAHKAYVPLDPSLPAERLRAMLEDSEATMLLTDDENWELAHELVGTRLPVVNTSNIRRNANALNPQVVCDPLDRAYILYSSESAGKPKGIVFLHRNLLHSTMCLTNRLFFAPSDRVSWLHPAGLSDSAVDIYCCLTNGAALYPWDVTSSGFMGLAEWLAAEKVTTLQWVPSAFREFLRSVPEDFVFDAMRLVMMAGESVTVREVDLFRRHFPNGCQLINQLGTSESYAYSLHFIDHETQFERPVVPGGYPVSPDREVLIVDDELKRVPKGETGQIAIKSDYMSGGYWHDDALTSKKFVALDDDGVLAFVTGDVGKLEQDGCLLHLGRQDFQAQAAAPEFTTAPARVLPTRQTVAARKKNLVIISAGKFGREVYAWATQMIAAVPRDYMSIKGFLDDRPNVLDGYDYATDIIGSVANYAIDEDDVFVSAMGDPADKVEYCAPIIEQGGAFTNIVHPLANLGGNIILGCGIVVGPFASISCDVTIGNHVSIGALSSIGPDVVIEDWCQIGSHSCILPGVRVGACAYVGAGGVVDQNVEADGKVFGNPARVE